MYGGRTDRPNVYHAPGPDAKRPRIFADRQRDIGMRDIGMSGNMPARSTLASQFGLIVRGLPNGENH
jgi:hypothetical protein